MKSLLPWKPLRVSVQWVQIQTNSTRSHRSKYLWQPCLPWIKYHPLCSHLALCFSQKQHSKHCLFLPRSVSLTRLWTNWRQRLPRFISVSLASTAWSSPSQTLSKAFSNEWPNGENSFWQLDAYCECENHRNPLYPWEALDRALELLLPTVPNGTMPCKSLLGNITFTWSKTV